MRNSESEYLEIKVNLKTGRERFLEEGTELDFGLIDFWKWSGSDLISNTARGVLAEYIVANALGIAGTKLRVEWDAFDLLTPDGVKIEVKSSSYLQSWAQKRLSKITFGIQRTRRWDPVTNTMVGELQRQADVYVFCVLATKNQNSLDPLKLEQWEFYILPTSVLDEKCAQQKTIGLERVKSLGAEQVKYNEIASCIRNLRLTVR